MYHSVLCVDLTVQFTGLSFVLFSCLNVVIWNRMRPRALLYNQQTMGSNCTRTIDVTHDIERRPTTTEIRVAYDNSTWHAITYARYINSTKTSSKKDVPCNNYILHSTHTRRHDKPTTEPVFIQNRTSSFDRETGATDKQTYTYIYMLASEEWIIVIWNRMRPI